MLWRWGHVSLLTKETIWRVHLLSSLFDTQGMCSKEWKRAAKIARYGWSASLVGNSIPTLRKKDDELMLVNDPF